MPSSRDAASTTLMASRPWRHDAQHGQSQQQPDEHADQPGPGQVEGGERVGLQADQRDQHGVDRGSCAPSHRHTCQPTAATMTIRAICGSSVRAMAPNAARSIGGRPARLRSRRTARFRVRRRTHRPSPDPAGHPSEPAITAAIRKPRQRVGPAGRVQLGPDLVQGHADLAGQQRDRGERRGGSGRSRSCAAFPGRCRPRRRRRAGSASRAPAAAGAERAPTAQHVGGEGNPDHAGIVVPGFYTVVVRESCRDPGAQSGPGGGGPPVGRFVGSPGPVARADRPGTNLLDIDAWARELIARAGAVSCYVDYAPSFGRGPFGKVICTSVNDAVLHGLPHDYALRAGICSPWTSRSA